MSQILTLPSLSWIDQKPYKTISNNYKVPQFQILKYMGNKRKLLSWIIPLLSKNLKEGDTLLDLFAGTSSIGYALKPKVRVIANDIQEYSSIISTALLTFNAPISELDFDKDLNKFYKKNLFRLLGIFEPAIQYEDKILSINSLKQYQKFCLYIPKYGELISNDKFNLNRYSHEDFITRKRSSNKSFPYILFSTYFPNTFFSLKQCLEVDSLRFAIEQMDNKRKRAVYLSCLMFAISKAVSSSGHFAEHLNHHSDLSSGLIMGQRKVSVLSQFLSKLSDFSNLYIQENWKNETYNYDYKIFIDKLHANDKLKEIDLIYIDPPYTSAQYSRFYHIPETLVKYDYPQITLDRSTLRPVKGRYRNDRHQSKFSQTAVVESAFREMFTIISSKTKATLAISYSDNSILKPVEKLIEIAKEHYEIVDARNGYSHSAQGSKFNSNGKGSKSIHEYLLICTPKK